MKQHSLEVSAELLGLVLGHKIIIERLKSLGNVISKYDKENKIMTYYIDSEDDEMSSKMADTLVK